MTGPSGPPPEGATLAGRVALVTGGSTGIGAAIVERFARDGASVLATARGEERGRRLEADLRAAGLDVRFEAGDVARREDCERMVRAAAERFGRLDIVVNNAAQLEATSVEESSDDEWELLIATNLTSVYRVSKAAIPFLREAGGGSIVNIASVHAVATVSHLAAYAAAKGGVVSLSRQMAHDLVADRIRVNAVVVGGVATDMSRKHGLAMGADPAAEVVIDEGVLGRTARPREIAGAIRFLVGPDASFVNGSAFVVDGGLLAKLSI
jgi:NAD(P)-dependent dehydrogenase (short-subunit alcohol dehydrogenase family)